MSQETFTVTCPACGKELNIPSELDSFSCMYCGERLLKASFAPAVPSDKDLSAKEYFEGHILHAITEYYGIDKQVTNSEYHGAFSRYAEGNAETFRQLDLAVRAGSCTAQEAALFFLDQLEHLWQSDRSRKMRKAAMLDTDKFVIAVFLVPMVREMKLPVSESFCEALQQEWCRRYPKSPFYLGTYDEMSAGFEKKLLGLCFITTAICRYEGKPDDCAELTAFRAFRDGYLLNCPDGEQLIAEYYDIAPGIVLHLDLSQDKDKAYAELRSKYLTPCYEDLLHGRQEQCKARYTEMVRTLERKYLN